MYIHPELMRGMAEERLETLRRAAAPRNRPRTVGDHAEIRIRLERSSDRAQLERLAALDGNRPVEGPYVRGERGGRVGAGVSLQDGGATAAPFAKPRQIVRLLELRAQQLSEPV